LGDLISLTTERLTAPVEGIHHAIADRWFGLAGPGGAPAHRAYRTLTAGVYSSIRLAGSALGKAAELAAVVANQRNAASPLRRTSVGTGLQASANALWGDELERRQSKLRIELGLRDIKGDAIGLDPVALARAYPEPTTRLVVLLHGLGETERCWRPPSDERATGIGETLAADGFTPLLIRYNTGRHVSDNGPELAELLDSITLSWPVAVEEIALVGNSMGGLVARSSVHSGHIADHRWVAITRHLVTLGTPHLGAPLEKGANVVSWSLSHFPETQPLGKFLNHRSSGIKDLRFGSVRDDDWDGTDPDTLLNDIVGDTPLPSSIEQHFVAGLVTNQPTHPVGALVGDLIVRVGSGIGRGRRREVAATDVRVLTGRRHFDLTRDSSVHEQVRTWLANETNSSECP
jgi:hypothetical protein